MEIASLGIRVTTSGVQQAATDLDKLDKAGAKTEKSAASISKSFDQNAKSAKELQFALRGVPAQFTDIATSLSSGQRPLQVLLQQGGQLKDMFGGIGPASKALGGYVAGLVNPLTIGAAALGAFAYALNQAQEEQSAFNKALLISGNYAGKTAIQLESLVSSIAKTSDVTQGTAREAIQRAAESGRFAGEQFDLVAEAAARMESATGQSVDDTIKKFEAIGKAPVDALLKLNETEHFLTQAQFDRVRGLEDEGRVQDAAAEGARIYAGRLADIATAAEAASPHLSRMWKEAKEGASAAWEETKKFSEFLAAAGEAQKNIPWYQKLGPVGGFRAAVTGLFEAEPVTAKSALPVGKTVDSAKARAYADFQKEGLQYATKQVKLEHDIAQAKAEGLKAGASQLEIDKRIADIQASYADKVKKERTAPNFRAQDMRELKAEIEAEGKLMDQRERSREAVAAYQATLQDMLATRQATIDLQVQSIGMGAKEAAQQQALIAIDEDYNRKRASLEQQQRNSTSQIDKAAYTQQLVDLKAYHDERVKIEKEGNQREAAAQADGLKGMQAAVADFIDSQNNLAGQMYDITTQFLGGFGDAFADFVSGTKSAKDAFGSLIDSMYRDALKFVANQEIKKLLESFNNTGTSSASAGGSSAGGWAGLFSSVVGAFGPGTIGAGLATGGIASPNSFHPVNERGPEIFTIHGRDYLSTGKSSVKVTPNAGVDRSVSVNQTIVVQGMIGRRTAEQVATATARQQRIAQSRNG